MVHARGVPRPASILHGRHRGARLSTARRALASSTLERLTDEPRSTRVRLATQYPLPGGKAARPSSASDAALFGGLTSAS